VVLIGLETMLDSDLIGERVSSPSVFSFCFSGAFSSGLQRARLQPLDVDGVSLQLIIDLADACRCDAPLATFCLSEFCCDGDSVLS
jgi:hypothetical protein